MAFRRALVKEHRTWLRSHLAKHPKCYDNWNRLYSQDKESALHEAVVRRFFESEEIAIEPNETGKARCPDFRCTTPKGKLFFVEAACIPAAKVTEKAELSNRNRRRGLVAYRPLTQRLAHVSRNKLEQCAMANAPVLVAVGTFHVDSTVLFDRPTLEFCLTGCQYIAWEIDLSNRRAVGTSYITTKYQGAAFFTEQGQQVCSPVSGLLYFRNRYEDPVEYGILHPNPKHKFKSAWLNCVSFGTIDPATLNVSWSKSNKNDPNSQYAKMRKAGWTEEKIERRRGEIADLNRRLEKAFRERELKRRNRD